MYIPKKNNQPSRYNGTNRAGCRVTTLINNVLNTGLHTPLGNRPDHTFRQAAISEIVIPRLHDQAGSTSWLDVCSTFARRLLDVCLSASCRLRFMHGSYLLDVCSTFARCLLDRVNGV